MNKNDIITKMAEVFCEAAEEDEVKKGIPPERAKLYTKKFKTLLETAQIEEELDSYTHNKYPGITEILVELYEKRNKLLKEYAVKCKKYLDDNGLPYSDDSNDEE